MVSHICSQRVVINHWQPARPNGVPDSKIDRPLSRIVRVADGLKAKQNICFGIR